MVFCSICEGCHGYRVHAYYGWGRGGGGAGVVHVTHSSGTKTKLILEHVYNTLYICAINYPLLYCRGYSYFGFQDKIRVTNHCYHHLLCNCTLLHAEWYFWNFSFPTTTHFIIFWWNERVGAIFNPVKCTLQIASGLLNVLETTFAAFRHSTITVFTMIFRGCL